MKIYICFIIYFALQAQGVPIARDTPCLNQFRLMNRSDYEPEVDQYLPECEADGVAWKPAQCSHHGQGSCFCVNTETGVIIQSTVSHTTAKENLSCVLTKKDTRPCQQKRNEISNFRTNHPNVPDLHVSYFPECLVNGNYKARQRSQRFFCVDTRTGEIIPETETDSKPITEEICQSFSTLWQQFMLRDRNSSQATNNHQYPQENVTETSCRGEFEFFECGCNRPCVIGTNMTVSPTSCNQCKPVCTCPENYYEYNGTCISVQQCFDMEPELSEIDLEDSQWTQYQNDHADEILKAYMSNLGEFPNIEEPVEETITETKPQEVLPETSFYPETEPQKELPESTFSPETNNYNPTSSEVNNLDHYFDYTEPTVVEVQTTNKILSRSQQSNIIKTTEETQTSSTNNLDQAIEHQEKEEIEQQEEEEEEEEEEVDNQQEENNINIHQEEPLYKYEYIEEEEDTNNGAPEFGDKYYYEETQEEPTSDESLPDTRFLSGANSEVENEKPSLIFDLLSLASAAPPDDASQNSLVAKKSG